MGKRGPTPQPVKILEKKGTKRGYHEDQLADIGAIEFVFGFVPTPPDILGDVGAAKWYEVLNSASQVDGYISTIDLPLLEQYCTLYEQINTLAKLAKTASPIVETDRGEKANPIFREYRDTVTAFNRLSAVFGFGPSYRNGLRLTKRPNQEKKEDDFKL